MRTPDRRPYQSPTLQAFGSVRNLTGGSGGMRNDGMGLMTRAGMRMGMGGGDDDDD
ncbi:MAG: lasso RiPP family leader peptide-containing protein [Pseudomonadota bacterium]